ncbi:hypothetical protein RIF29_24101 [Crotalaria pallida]|uniref:Uncharacterized protein n=1 Tax=Crotalaria pallida TaxID=3830 RepID=A0AAN9I2X4_CROPI
MYPNKFSDKLSDGVYFSFLEVIRKFAPSNRSSDYNNSPVRIGFFTILNSSAQNYIVLQFSSMHILYRISLYSTAIKFNVQSCIRCWPHMINLNRRCLFYQFC